MTAEYAYRADGLRRSKSVNGALRMHIWSHGRMVVELNGSGGMTDRFIWGNSLLNSWMHGYYVLNARGDVVMRLNFAGVVQQMYRYSAFGVEISPRASDTNPMRFAGEYLDFETGRYYLRARLYDPRNGRFTQPDPFWNVGNMIWGSSPVTMGHGVMRPDAWAIMQSGNLFVFGLNNPVFFVDPSGLFVRRALEATRDMFVNSWFALADLFDNNIPLASYIQALTGVDMRGNRLSVDERVDMLMRGLEMSTNAVMRAYVMGGIKKTPTGGTSIQGTVGQPSGTGIRMTAAQATAAAKALGYRKISETSHGQPVFERISGKGPRFITPDVDMHNGGVWKGANSIRGLGSKTTRSGTFNADLGRIGD